MHPARLRCESLEYPDILCVFAPCRPDASTLKIANLFLCEPLAITIFVIVHSLQLPVCRQAGRLTVEKTEKLFKIKIPKEVF